MYHEMKPSDIKNETHQFMLDGIQHAIKELKDFKYSTGPISDSYHTFDELYHHRAILFASLLHVPEIADCAWKSKQHHDPEKDPMYDGMFIIGIDTPDGQATYHYDIDPYWDVFDNIKEIPNAPEFDGHTPEDAIRRIYHLCEGLSRNCQTADEVEARRFLISLIRSFTPKEIQEIGKGFNTDKVPVDAVVPRICSIYNRKTNKPLSEDFILNMYRTAGIDELVLRLR